MSHSPPKVSIGLPVYNGENYLSDAIASILSQTYRNFELVICNNASTDSTDEICRKYAKKDSRIRYYQNEKNIGASGNYSRVFELSKGTYFKWAAHDDICLPEFLEHCVKILDREPDVVLAHTRAACINEHGKTIYTFQDIDGLDLHQPVQRFKSTLFLEDSIFYIWGLMRKEIMAKTPLLANYVGHDRPFLTGMSLFGRFKQSEEILFHQREHPERSVHKFDWKRPRQAIEWHDPSKANKLSFPNWRVLFEHLKAINRAPLSISNRFSCYSFLSELTWHQRTLLWKDLLFAVDFIPHRQAKIIKWLDPNIKDIERNIPEENLVILVDQEKLETDIFGNRQTVPFPEKDGMYWGPPADDQSAIQELDRQKIKGANFIVFAPSAFWWLEYYSGFHHYLNSNFDCVLKNRRFVIFDLRN